MSVMIVSPPRAAALLAVGALGLSACGRAPDAPAPAAPTAGADRLTVQAVETPDLKPMAAVVTARDMAEARARIGGTLTTLTVKAGDVVRRGQVIGVVRDARLGLQTQAFDAQAGAAEAEAGRARAELARIQDLYDHGVYARARLDQAQAAARAAEGGLKAARAQSAASAQTAAQGQILAPSDGRVLSADVPAGSVVSPGQSIAILTAGPTVIRLEAPEADAAALRVGDRLTIDGGAEAAVLQVYPGVVAGQVRADLSAEGVQSRFVGQRLTVRAPVGRRRAVIIPRRFVISRYGVDYVRVVAPGGGAQDAPVQLTAGPKSDEVEALSGLQPGDVIAAPEPGR